MKHHLNIGLAKLDLAIRLGFRFRGIPTVSEHHARVSQCQGKTSYSDETTLQNYERDLLVGEFTIEAPLKFRYTEAGPSVDAECC